MRIGYARVSTADQDAGFEAQVEALSGCDKLYSERASAIGARPELDAAIGYLRDGDVLVVTRLDRLARSTAHLLQIMETLDAKGAALECGAPMIDTATASGKLVLSILGSIAEFERALMLERQREGIAAAKRAGKYKGRAPTARAKADQIMALRGDGMGASAIAKAVGVSRASVYRIIADAAA